MNQLTKIQEKVPSIIESIKTILESNEVYEAVTKVLGKVKLKDGRTAEIRVEITTNEKEFMGD